METVLVEIDPRCGKEYTKTQKYLDIYFYKNEMQQY